MTKIDGKYEDKYVEKLRQEIEEEDSITKRHHLISKYLMSRWRQVEKIVGNIDDDEIDLTMVVEQLWDDILLAHDQLQMTNVRSDFYADYYGLKK